MSTSSFGENVWCAPLATNPAAFIVDEKTGSGYERPLINPCIQSHSTIQQPHTQYKEPKYCIDLIILCQAPILLSHFRIRDEDQGCESIVIHHSTTHHEKYISSGYACTITRSHTKNADTTYPSPSVRIPHFKTCVCSYTIATLTRTTPPIIV